MATNKKSSFFLTLATGAEAEVQLDPDIYNAAMLTETGLTATKATGSKLIKVSTKVLAASSFAQMLRLSVAKGTNPDTATEFRSVRVICETAKVDTAVANLIGKTIKLGYGTSAVDWTVTGVR